MRTLSGFESRYDKDRKIVIVPRIVTPALFNYIMEECPEFESTFIPQSNPNLIGVRLMSIVSEEFIRLADANQYNSLKKHIFTDYEESKTVDKRCLRINEKLIVPFTNGKSLDELVHKYTKWREIELNESSDEFSKKQILGDLNDTYQKDFSRYG